MDNQLRDSLVQLSALLPELTAVSESVSRERKRIEQILEEKRANYENEKSRLAEQENRLNAQIAAGKQEESQLEAQMAKQVQDRDGSIMRVREMKLQEQELDSQIAKYKQEIGTLERSIEAKLKQLNDEKTFLLNQNSIIDDRAYEYEQLLGLRIETGSKGHELSFVFRNVDPDNFQREVYFVLDPDTYQVVKTSPQLPEEVVDAIVNKFTKRKEIGVLWREMRKELRQALLN